jgi:hypothetical protein
MVIPARIGPKKLELKTHIFLIYFFNKTYSQTHHLRSVETGSKVYTWTLQETSLQKV